MRPIDLKDVAIVGEMTTEDGPILDDHFLLLVFWDASVVRWESSRPEATHALEVLSQRWGSDLSYCMLGRTDFASRVMYPAALKERSIVYIQKDASWKGFWENVRMLGYAERDILLTPEITRYLSEKRPVA